MKFWKKICLLLITSSYIFGFSSSLFSQILYKGPFFLDPISIVNADEDDDDDEGEEERDELKDKIEEYEERLERLQEEERSLQNEIEYANSQISLTSLKIQDATAEITDTTVRIQKLSEDITDLKKRIERLEKSVDYQERIYAQRKRADHKLNISTPKEVEFLLFLFEPTELTNKTRKDTYSLVMQARDLRLLNEMRETKVAYGKQRDLFEEKKDEEKKLRAQIQAQKATLESYQAELDRRKVDKEKLLEKTQNDEAKYQALLAQARSELAALELAFNLPEGEGVEVEKGDVIGYMGNTGCSTGPHLHFGYVKDGKSVDPLPYLERGKLKWPVSDWAITQYFGENYDFYMRNFGIPGHDAIDIMSTSQWSGAPIKAAKDGVLYYAQDEKIYCPWFNNSYGKGAIIAHDDDERTIYWHLQ